MGKLHINESLRLRDLRIVTLCGDVVGYQSFGDTVRCQNPEHNDINLYRSGNLKPRIS